VERTVARGEAPSPVTSGTWHIGPGHGAKVDEPRSGRLGTNLKFLVAGGVIALALVYLIVAGLRGTTEYFLTVSELQAKSPTLQNQVLRVSGTLVPGSLMREADGLSVEFLIADGGDPPLTVMYKGGQVPDTMADASINNIQVVAEGKLNAQGAFTATEVLQAWRAGAVVVKLFPAGSVGPGYIKDVLGPLREVPLLPTGGVTGITFTDLEGCIRGTTFNNPNPCGDLRADEMAWDPEHKIVLVSNGDAAIPFVTLVDANNPACAGNSCVKAQFFFDGKGDNLTTGCPAPSASGVVTGGVQLLFEAPLDQLTERGTGNSVALVSATRLRRPAAPGQLVPKIGQLGLGDLDPERPNFRVTPHASSRHRCHRADGLRRGNGTGQSRKHRLRRRHPPGRPAQRPSGGSPARRRRREPGPRGPVGRRPPQ